MMSSRIHPGAATFLLGEEDGRIDPSIHDVIRRRRLDEPGRKLVCFRDRVRLDGGGARRDRTDDLMLAKHALSQLSYGPAPKALLAAVAGRPGRRPARPKAAAHVCASAQAAEAAAGA